ncbi:T-cell surface glycoprotein CD1a, partial [Macaca mulatta]
FPPPTASTNSSFSESLTKPNFIPLCQTLQTSPFCFCNLWFYSYNLFFYSFHFIFFSPSFPYFITPDPFEIQVTGGCELHSGKFSGSFHRLAYQGSDFVSFQNNSWLPSPVAGNMANRLCKVLNQNQHQNDITHSLLSDTCPRLILGLLDAGKAHLQRQVKPEAWLSRGLSPGPGRLQLVCHVSGFYPKPVWVMWMRGEQEQQGTQRGDILPNADGTWYLRATLEVAAGEAADLSCRVKHSSLEGQDIIPYWEHHSSMGLIILAVIVPLLLLIGLVLWFRKHCFR